MNGRRFGKTTLIEDRLVAPALGGYPVAYFAPTYKMMQEVWRDVRRTLRPVTTKVSEQQHRLEFVGGGLLDLWSLDSPDVARGRKYKRAAIDEAAMIRHLMEAWQAVIRPTLVDYEGDAWFGSTPKGRDAFWQMWQWGQDPGLPEWASWQLPTTDNPYIDPAEVEAMRATMPENIYRQEVLAEFMEDGNGVFRRVREAATLDAEFGRVDPDRPRQTVMGCDWGRTIDFTCLVVMDVDTFEVVDFDRFNQIDWEFQRRRLAALYQKWGCTSILAERNSIGDPNIEALQRAGLPVQGFTTTNATKGTIIEALSLAIETRAIAYPPIPQLIAELQAYEMERLPSGLARYNAPEGMHDDCVIALALALTAAQSGRAVMY